MKNDTPIVETADLIIKPDSGLVEIRGEQIRLGPVNMKVLMELVNNQHRVVSRDDLFDSVWRNQMVSDDTLTRCISDLRNKIGKISCHESLIVTVPKKGYQWKPSELLVSSSSKTNPSAEKNNWFSSETLLALGLFVMILFVAGLVLKKYIVQPRHTAVLLVPIEVSQPHQQHLADSLEDSLRDSILKTKSLRFLANTVSSKEPGSVSFRNLSSVYGVQWAIEGRIRQQEGAYKLTLSLVDAHTALELYSKTFVSPVETVSLESHCLEFILEVDKKIN